MKIKYKNHKIRSKKIFNMLSILVLVTLVSYFLYKGLSPTGVQPVAENNNQTMDEVDNSVLCKRDTPYKTNPEFERGLSLLYQRIEEHQSDSTVQEELKPTISTLLQIRNCLNIQYSDSEIDITLDIVDLEDRQGIIKSAYDQLSELQEAFRKKDNYKLPRIFSISSPLTDCCGIRNVLFKGLEVEDIPGDTVLKITLILTEFEPIAVQVERNRTRKQVSKAAQKQAQQAASVNQDSKQAENEIGTESPLAAAYRDGKKAAMGGTEP